MVAAGELASSTLTTSRLLTLAKRSPGTRGRVKHEQHTGDGERGSSETDAHEGVDMRPPVLRCRDQARGRLAMNMWISCSYVLSRSSRSPNPPLASMEAKPWTIARRQRVAWIAAESWRP
jgi:hypothetical protein